MVEGFLHFQLVSWEAFRNERKPARVFALAIQEREVGMAGLLELYVLEQECTSMRVRKAIQVDSLTYED